MTPKLERCPFCGGEARITEYNGGFAAVGCSNGRCSIHPHAFGFPSAERAAEVWNSRVMKTCTLAVTEDEEKIARRDAEARPGTFVTQDIPLCCKCTSCGAKFRPYAEVPKWLRYCPHCGAKVEDDRDGA